MSEELTWVIPFGGNGFVRNSTPASTAVITSTGLLNWNSENTTVSLYFYAKVCGKISAQLRLRVPVGSSRIRFAFSQNNCYKQRVPAYCWSEIDIQGDTLHLVSCGNYTIPDEGYVRLDLEGVVRTGPCFAEVADLVITSESLELQASHLRFVEDLQDFYCGRRGPAVQLRFPQPPGTDIDYFYNEVFVPEGQDVVGATYGAIGFTGGSCGLQVTSENERKVVFSVWSEIQPDNSCQAASNDFRVTPIRLGEGAEVLKLENQGGTECCLNFQWKPETTYKLIVQGRPLDSKRSLYSAWFHSGIRWALIGSFEVTPKISKYLTGFHCFSENLIPEAGWQERHCLFGNQWVRCSDGRWTELTHAQFEMDHIGRREIRMDAFGGVGLDLNYKRFYLRNCGFFSNRLEENGVMFERARTGTAPPVNVFGLP